MTPKRTRQNTPRMPRRPPRIGRKPAATPPPRLKELVAFDQDEVAEQLANLITLTDRLADECRHLGTRIAAIERDLLALRSGPAVPSDVVPGA